MNQRIAGPCALFVLSAAAASAQVPSGGEFQANTFTTGSQRYPTAAASPTGEFFVFWSGPGLHDADGGISGRRFGAGGTPIGAEFGVNTFTTGIQWGVDVALAGRNEFLVVWSSFPTPTTSSLQAQRLDPTGAAIGAEFQLNAGTTGPHLRPVVDSAADGRFVVTWGGFDGSGEGVFARRFAAEGLPIGSDFRVNSSTLGDQLYGAVAIDDAGRFVVVWADEYGSPDGSLSAIVGQRFDAGGTPVGGEFIVNSYTTGQQKRPKISAAPAGGFVVTWRGFGDGDGYGAFARRLDTAGQPVGSDFVVNSYTNGQQGIGTDVVHDAHGGFVVTWGGAGDGSALGVAGQRFDSSGTRRGGEFQVNTVTTGYQWMPAVGSDPFGNFMIAWDTPDGSSTGVAARTFGGLRPGGLAVDSFGNSVLEPGEIVDVRPSWQNENAAPLAFGGRLRGMSGPSGAVYAVLDAEADYRSVASGTTEACDDCYVVFVSNPTARPALHWDAAATESIVPDTLGQQAAVVLHVGRSFADTPPASPFYSFVEAMLHHGVTGGCSPTEYCPAGSTTREQMAVFVLAAKERLAYAPPACGATPMFADVPVTSPFCRWVEELARRGVTTGCGGGNYCPSASVTREQMAAFVLRTLDPALSPPACGTPVFTDVPATSPFCRWIEELVRRGVVAGCGGGNYCPTSAVTREQMSVFLGVTFGLSLYGA